MDAFLTERCTVCNFGGLSFLIFYVNDKKVWNLRAKKYQYPPHEISIRHAEEEKEIKGWRGRGLVLELCPNS